MIAGTFRTTHKIIRAAPIVYRNMASASGKFDINTSYKLNSGHQIPVLGYGVYQT
jgi:hypothetical protein